MDNQELLNYMRFFREKANSDKLIVFVGAGVSCNVENMPSWNTLIQKMADSIHYTKCSNCKKKDKKCKKACKFKDSFSSDEYLKIPQYVFNRSKKLYNQVLYDNIQHDASIDAPLSNAIFDLAPSHIITTNYDRLIENCKNIQRDNYEVVINDKDLLSAEKNKYIIKMHGDIGDLDTIVLKEVDYLEYTQKHVLIEMFIKSLLTDHTILFLGYSLNDYNVKLIISWINYIRTQNKALDKTTKFAYIVLDEQKIASNQLKYFESNNIGVINLHNMPLVTDIPNTLTDPIGKRLYSFLRTTYDESLESVFGQVLSYEGTVELLSSYNYVDAKNICKILCLGSHTINGYELIIHSESTYNKLVEFLKSSTDNAKKLNQIFVDAGILKIRLSSATAGLRFPVYNIEGYHISLLNDLSYQLYLLNNYKALKEMTDDTDAYTISHRSFYRTLVYNYTEQTFKEYDSIDYDELSVQNKVAYLFNAAVLESQSTFRYNSDNVEKYIKGISNNNEKSIYSLYLDILEGNNYRLLKMEDSLKKLKENYYDIHYAYMGNSLGELFIIKHIAMEQYMFYFKNQLFYTHFSDIKNILKKYIEAIICTNGKFADETKSALVGKSIKSRYIIDILDIDILTKFISIKDLINLIDEYKLEKFQAHKEVVDFLVDSFDNIAKSILELQLFHRFLPESNILVNSAVLLNHSSLNDEQKEKVSKTLKMLFTNADFIDSYFSVLFSESSKSLSVFNTLLKEIPIKCEFEHIKRICTAKKFEEYYINHSVYSIRSLLSNCIEEQKLIASQNQIKDFILSFDGKSRIMMIRLFKKYITDIEIKSNLETLISNNWDILSSDDIIDFVFDEWLNISSEMSQKLQNDATEKYSQRKASGVITYPDYVQQQIETICLLYITEVITELNMPQEIIEGNIFLKFLTDSDNFDYSQVDFSYYMWENIARRPRFMNMLCEHKESIIPQIQRKVEMDTATEFEKKVLYGMFLNKDELFIRKR